MWRCQWGGRRTSDPRGSIEPAGSFKGMKVTKEGEVSCVWVVGRVTRGKGPITAVWAPLKAQGHSPLLGQSHKHSLWVIRMIKDRNEQLPTPIHMESGCWPATLQITSVLFILLEERSAPLLLKASILCWQVQFSCTYNTDGETGYMRVEWCYDTYLSKDGRG